MGILAIASLVQSGIGLAQGIAGGISAAKLAKREPKYEIPKEVGEAVGLARGMAAEGMPAAQRTMAQQDIQQAALMAQQASADRRGGLMAAPNVQAQMGRQMASLAAQDAAMRQQNQRFAYSALMAGASYADKEFANRWQSWMNKYQQARAAAGAGIQNVTQGLQTYAAGKIQQDFLNKYYGDGQSGSQIGGQAGSQAASAALGAMNPGGGGMFGGGAAESLMGGTGGGASYGFFGNIGSMIPNIPNISGAGFKK